MGVVKRGSGRRRMAILLLALAALGAGGAWRAGWHVPERQLPWTPMFYSDTHSLWSDMKINRLQDDARECHRFLDETPMQYRPVENDVFGPGCSFTNVVQVEPADRYKGQAFSLRCGTAAALVMWRHHVVEPAARRYLGTELAKIEDFGSYSCRNVYGRASGRRSEHATANAIDISGFDMADGQRITVAANWNSGDARAKFLRVVGAGACDWFHAVLGPPYNRAHADHLHLDRGPYRICSTVQQSGLEALFGRGLPAADNEPGAGE